MMPKAIANLRRISVNANASTRFGARNRATVRELGQIVRSADPESKTISKSSPQPLVDQEFVPTGGSTRIAERQERRSMNPLAVGLGLLVLGAGLFIFIPAVALVLGILGLIGVSLGGFGRST